MTIHVDKILLKESILIITSRHSDYFWRISSIQNSSKYQQLKKKNYVIYYKLITVRTKYICHLSISEASNFIKSKSFSNINYPYITSKPD